MFTKEGPTDKEHLLKALITSLPYLSYLISLSVEYQKEMFISSFTNNLG